MRKNMLLVTQSSLVHGGNTLGVGKYLHRENFMLPNGEVENLPVVSGNALRGALRDQAAEMFQEIFPTQQFSLPISHALWAGGAVSKSRGIPLSGEKLRTVRSACPPLALFGWASAGRIISGSLSVGKMLPVCSELAHLLPAETLPASLPSYWDLTQLEEFSHFPDHSSPEDNTSILMRYAVESFIPGTQFSTWSSATTRTDQEELFYRELINRLMLGDVAIGGLKNRGSGIVKAPETSGLEHSDDWKTALLDAHSTEEIVDLLEEHIK